MCSATTWDARFASCEAPQEQSGVDGGPPSGPVGAAAGVWVRTSSSLVLSKRHRNTLGGKAIAVPAQAGSKRGRKSNVERAAFADAAVASIHGRNEGYGGMLVDGADGGDAGSVSGDESASDGGGAGAGAGAGGGTGRRSSSGRVSTKAKKEGPIYLAERWPLGSTEHIFWKGVEKSWDDMGISGNSRKLPILSGKLVDLFDLYGAMLDAGGYDVVNSRLGGWTSLYRSLPTNVAQETSGSCVSLSRSFFNDLRKYYI